MDILLNFINSYKGNFVIWFFVDIFNISLLRELLFSFLEGATGRKQAEKIREEQTAMDKLRLIYIRPYLIQHRKLFSIYRVLYLISLWALPVFTISFITLVYIYGPMPWIRYAIAVNTMLVIFMNLFIRTKFSWTWKPKYRE